MRAAGGQEGPPLAEIPVIAVPGVGWELRASPSIPWMPCLPLPAYTTNSVAMETDTPTEPQAPSGGRQFPKGNEAAGLPRAQTPDPRRQEPRRGGGHRLPCCSKWRPPHSSGDLAERATGPAAGMAGKWDLKGPWGLSARRSMAWRVGLQGGKEERWVGAAAPGCARAGRGPTVEGGHGDTCPVCRAF